MANILGSNFRAIKIEEWMKFVSPDNDLIHYATPIERPGNIALMTAIEYFHFPPSTPMNDNFHVNLIDWSPRPWQVFSVPTKWHDVVIKAAEELAMRICKHPPALLACGNSAFAFTVPTNAKDAEIKALLIQVGLPKVLVDSFSGKESFPGSEFRTIHAIENDERRLKSPLRREELQDIRKRELAMNEAVAHGARPTLKDMAAYIYGTGRVISPKK